MSKLRQFLENPKTKFSDWLFHLKQNQMRKDLKAKKSLVMGLINDFIAKIK